ncbi:hypothetical protein [Zavarzinia sp.]|uniref:DUF6984 family protein n=1 Tax=Zavarzinia sp. TaxID=2027920 RepID=UPI003562A32A
MEVLLARNVSGADRFLDQMSGCRVEAINDDETILRFHLRPTAESAELPYIQNVAVEAQASDIDGFIIEILLHVKEGKIFELEYLRRDGNPIGRRPTGRDLSEFIIYF